MTAAALPCLCLAGPTAAGKTAAALAVAGHWPVEIISVDSASVYRQMDVGTAKPSAAERAAAPHHLIDILDPSERYSAGRFVADAERLIDAIHARGRWPLLVGGTMLYFKALFDGLATLPAASAEVRAELDAWAARAGWPALHAELARVDPVTAARLAPADAQRIQRALEVYRVSGQPLSDLHAQEAERPRRPAVMISLEPDDRAWLHRRIEARFKAMLEAGLVAEVEGLRARGDLQPSLPALRSVGYRQVWEALDRGALGTAAGRAELLASGTAATRQLAKRQLTWLRSMPDRLRVACDQPDAIDQVLSHARRVVRPGA